MAIEKLNFSGTNFNPSIGKSTSELLIGYGKTLNDQRDNEIALKQKEEAIKYQRSRDALIDSRYEADRKERLDDKFDAKQKDSMTNEALALIGNKDAFLSGKISAENKAYADALSQISDPAERARMEQEIKSYQASGQQKQSWIDSTLGQSNIDNSKILDLKRDIEKEAENKRRFDLQLAEIRATRADAKNERAREMLDAKKAVAELVRLSTMDDPNMSSSGVLFNVNQVKTGNKTIPNGVSIPEGEGSKELSEMDEITNKINSLSSKNLDKDGKQINFANKDEAFKAYMEENPEAANSNAAIKGIDRSLKGASNLASATIKNMFLPSEGLGKAFDKSKQIFMSDVEREEYNKKLDEAKAKEAQESLKSNDKDDKAKSGNISFEDYWSLKKQQQTLDNAELGKLQEELGKKSLTYSDNLANKYGVDEIKSVPKEMTPHEAKIHVTKNTVKSLIERGVSEENALKLGLEEGEKAFKFQTNYINNVNENAKETAKNRYTEVKEERKALQDQIKTLESRKFDIGKSKESKIVYNGKTVKLSEVQDGLDNEISRLKKELAELK